MTNEGLKFGALALGIALVILIIILIVHRSKDKYDALHGGKLGGTGKGNLGGTGKGNLGGTGKGNLGGTGKGCCSLGNATACSIGNYYDTSTGCSVKGATNPGNEDPGGVQAPGGCICNGQGLCAPDGADSGVCTCQFTDDDTNSPSGRIGTPNGLGSTNACQQCPEHTVVSIACQLDANSTQGASLGIPCPQWDQTGGYTCSNPSYDQPCTIYSAQGIEINTACETVPPPPPVPWYACRQTPSYSPSYSLTRSLMQCAGPPPAGTAAPSDEEIEAAIQHKVKIGEMEIDEDGRHHYREGASLVTCPGPAKPGMGKGSRSWQGLEVAMSNCTCVDGFEGAQCVNLGKPGETDMDKWCASCAEYATGETPCGDQNSNEFAGQCGDYLRNPMCAGGAGTVKDNCMTTNTSDPRAWIIMQQPIKGAACGGAGDPACSGQCFEGTCVGIGPSRCYGQAINACYEGACACMDVNMLGPNVPGYIYYSGNSAD